MEYSSSRVWRCGGTQAPTGNGCSTIDTRPLVCSPKSLKTTPMVPRFFSSPSPGWMTVSSGWSTSVMVSPPSVALRDTVMYHQRVDPKRTVVNTLSEQGRSTNSRGYRKVKRADDEQRTRARIVDAAEELHGTVGPAGASISAIADKAGVTRATVYRHFPDDESLFLACSGQWLARQRLPDPDAWEVPGDPWASLRTGSPTSTATTAPASRCWPTSIETRPSFRTAVRNARLGSERRWREALLRAAPGRRACGREGRGRHTRPHSEPGGRCASTTPSPTRRPPT